jgi:hypothetical protein
MKDLPEAIVKAKEILGLESEASQLQEGSV